MDQKKLKIILALNILIVLCIYYYVLKVKNEVVVVYKVKNLNPSHLITNSSLLSRSSIGNVLELIKAENMVEIGVQRGYYAKEVLALWPSFKSYYGIDPWAQQINYKDAANMGNSEQEGIYQEARNSLKAYGNRISLIRNISTNAVNLFDDDSIDFVYVDARHDYCGAMADMTMFYPKLKCNGIMGGHDFINFQEQKQYNPSEDWSICEDGRQELSSGGLVKGAVIDFIKIHNVKTIAITKEQYASYFFVKNC